MTMSIVNNTRMASERPRPTDAELNILRVLWENGPLSVRAVLHILNADKPFGYTNILKTMQVMTDKGLLERDESCRPQIYRPTDPQKQTQSQLLRHMVERAFGGSTRAMVLQALSEDESSTAELDELEKLLDRIHEAKK